MSHIADELRAAATTTTTQPCLVGRFIAERLDDEDRAVVAALFADQLKAKLVHQVLTANGMTASASSVRAHRRGECICAKAAPAEGTRA